MNLARNWIYKKEPKQTTADDGCNLVEVDTAKAAQSPESKNYNFNNYKL